MRCSLSNPEAASLLEACVLVSRQAMWFTLRRESCGRI